MGIRICIKLSFLKNVSQDTEILLNCLKSLPIFRFFAYSDIKIDINSVPEMISS